MSERTSVGVPRPARRPADRGMTLPELLIAVTMVGLIIAVLSSAVIVTLKQEDSTAGRFNVARAEQQVGMWLPGDLASAAVISTDPLMTACAQREVEGEWVVTGDTCPGVTLPPGSNALMVGWSISDGDGAVTYTNVLYHFSQQPDGLYQLHRVECVNAGGGWSCEVVLVLGDLPGPPLTDPWEPGDPPSWIITVTQPLAADADDESDVVIGDTGLKNAKRVIVTVNGGGASGGAGGGSNQISITAGGTNRNEIDGTSLQGAPTFADAISPCGGPMVLIVDESNSIGNSNGAYVRTAAKDFVSSLAGTPVKIMVVGFHTFSHVLGGANTAAGWHHYYDMTDPTQVSTLLALIDQPYSSGGLSFSWSGGSNGGTNWEEGMFRTFYNADGTIADPIPEKVVFFTDGIPTFHRLNHKTDPGVIPAQPPAPHAGWPTSTGNSFTQVGYDRAEYIAEQFRSLEHSLIGVAVGAGATDTTARMSQPVVGYYTQYERAYRQYQQVVPYYQSNIDFEKANAYQSQTDFERATGFQTRLDPERASGFQTRFDFETASTFESNLDLEAASWQSNRDFENNVDFEVRSGGWNNATLDQYLAASSSNRRIRTESRPWTDVDPEDYYAYRNSLGSTSNWRINSTARTAYSVSQATYNLYNTTSDFSDGWQTVWTDTTAATYYANQPGNTSAYRINTPARSTWYSVTTAQYDANRSSATSNFRVATWANTSPTTYYTNQPGTPHKYQLGTDTSWKTVTEAEYDTYRTNTPANWQVSSWANTSVTDYQTNQPTNTAKYRMGTDTGWKTASEAEFDTYRAASPSNWQVGTWSDTTPSTYFPNQSNTTKYRVNGTRTWYTVTEVEYDTYRTNTPANWRVNGWNDTTAADYYANQPTNTAKYRTNGSRSTWSDVTKALYDAHNTNTNETDGWRISNVASWVTKATYDANNTVAGSSDGWNDVGTPEYVSASNAMDWMVWTTSTSGIPSDQLRTTEKLGPPYQYYSSPVYGPEEPNSQIIGDLVAGLDNIETAVDSNGDGEYDNAATANLYATPLWSALPKALKTIALGECGGTVTLQTKYNGSPANDPFKYVNSKVYDTNGNELVTTPRVDFTSRAKTTANFDFQLEGGTARDVVIMPENLSDLALYQPAGWTCRAGITPRSFTLVDIPGFESSAWKGIRVRVAANEAVSCVQAVTR